jgi:hypothetical protein
MIGKSLLVFFLFSKCHNEVLYITQRDKKQSSSLHLFISRFSKALGKGWISSENKQKQSFPDIFILILWQTYFFLKEIIMN